MPDHLHMIASQGRSSVSLGQWIKAFKAVVAKREFASQQGFFDHLIRSQESESEKWEYIGLNPVCKGLVPRSGRMADNSSLLTAVSVLCRVSV